MLKEHLLALPRGYKRLIQIGVDRLLIWVSLGLACVLTGGNHALIKLITEGYWLLVITPLVTLPTLIKMGMYRSVIRYLGEDAFWIILKSISLSVVLNFIPFYLLQYFGLTHISPAFIFNYWVLALLTLGGLRQLMRYYLGNTHHATAFNVFKDRRVNAPKVAIYGAGAAGNQLLSALKMSNELKPVAFIDDDLSLAKRNIAGLPVYAPFEIKVMLEKTQAAQVLLAIPSTTRERRREILSALESYPVHVRTIPGLTDLANGKVKVQDIQEVDIADLLGRDEVVPNQELFERCIKERVVMVTGAGGSIGSELCRQIIGNQAIQLILYEHSEFNLYNIHRELSERIKNEGLSTELIPILGSIRNFKRLREVMLAWEVNTVYHAAAYKHVPMVEHNTVEGVLNNVFGTLNTAQAAITAQVENFVLISTDKAVRPTNIMGGTKRLAEMILQALSKEQEVQLFNRDDANRYANKTRFTMVRFGNVLGSSGSVIPLFREQIKKGGPVTVTHPNITRFFMTIPEAAQLVIQAGSMGIGGDVFVLDMGEPVKIANLAEKMILLTGYSVRSEHQPNGDIEIVYSGLRPGEKLYEELLIGETEQPTEHEKIMRANEMMLPWPELKESLKKLLGSVAVEDCESIRKILRQTVEGYQPQGNIVDLVFNQKQSLPIEAFLETD